VREVADLPPFDRRFFDGTEAVTRLGSGSIGGKAGGLAFIRGALTARLDPATFPGISVDVPRMVVIATGFFDQFIAENKLDRLQVDNLPDAHIALAFQAGELPVELVGDLRALVDGVRSPLAIRSSSLLEDALFRPFAGVYGTKMIPNNHFDPNIRFRRVVEAIKFVWASTWFAEARDYLRATGQDLASEKMAVIVQEVVGRDHRVRFYPDLSGVARSHNFYPPAGLRPEDGVVDLALGLGRTIVDGEVAWTYSPSAPARTPPFAGLSEMLNGTQTRFWAVNMDNPPAYDPVNEVEYLVEGDLSDAAADETLRFVASVYDRSRERFTYDPRARGPRVINFAPLLLLEELPVNALVRSLLDVCERACNARVEIEFAMTFDAASNPPKGRLGFLQVRPLVASDAVVDISDDELADPSLLLASTAAMGNGVDESIRDVVFVRPDRFDPMKTPAVAAELEALNRKLVGRQVPYLLIGFGRWGSSHRTLGIPVTWSQIAGARAIVEAMLPSMNVEPSQGSHFFHNLSSFEVAYFTVPHSGAFRIDWEWLSAQPLVSDSGLVRHVHLAEPLQIKVDGRTTRGLIRHR
jgi:hypothetical protein